MEGKSGNGFTFNIVAPLRAMLYAVSFTKDAAAIIDRVPRQFRLAENGVANIRQKARFSLQEL